MLAFVDQCFLQDFGCSERAVCDGTHHSPMSGEVACLDAFLQSDCVHSPEDVIRDPEVHHVTHFRKHLSHMNHDISSAVEIAFEMLPKKQFATVAFVNLALHVCLSVLT